MRNDRDSSRDAVLDPIRVKLGNSPPMFINGSGVLSTAALEGLRPYLLAVAARRMGTELTAKVGASDLVQDTLLAAHRDAETFRGSNAGDLRAWLKSILRHVIANRRRHYFDTIKRRVGAELPFTVLAEGGRAWATLAASGTSPSGRAMREELRTSVTRGLSCLPEHYRQVLLWRYRDGLAFEEIGVRLGTSADAARKLWGRAVVRLREALGPDHAPA